MKIDINYKKEKLGILVKEVRGFFKFIGLMFRTRNTENLLFEFNKDVNIGIHSFFVFFPFLVVWLDEWSRVLDFQIVKPFCFCIKPRFKFRKFVEIPINERNRDILDIFVKHDYSERPK